MKKTDWYVLLTFLAAVLAWAFFLAGEFLRLIVISQRHP